MTSKIIVLMLSREAGWEWEYLQSKKGEKEVRVKSKSFTIVRFKPPLSELSKW